MKRFTRILTLLLVALAVFSLAACSDNSSSSESEATTAVTEGTVDEKEKENETTPKRDVNLSELHAINYDGNDFAGAWHITEREEGDTYNSFTYVFDGDSSAYLMMGSMGYISNYELNPDINQIATQMMFGINGKYTYEFSDDKNSVTLTDSKTKKKTTLEKYMSFSCIPLPEADAKIDNNIVGAWKDDSGGFLYFDDQGIMYETQKGLSFTFYNYSAEDGKINTKCFMPDETKASVEYSVDGDTLTYNGYKYEKAETSELV